MQVSFRQFLQPITILLLPKPKHSGMMASSSQHSPQQKIQLWGLSLTSNLQQGSNPSSFNFTTTKHPLLVSTNKNVSFFLLSTYSSCSIVSPSSMPTMGCLHSSASVRLLRSSITSQPSLQYRYQGLVRYLMHLKRETGSCRSTQHSSQPLMYQYRLMTW